MSETTRAVAPRSLAEIIAHIRMAVANPNVSTTLIQTQDLEVLCDAAERASELEASGTEKRNES